MTMISNRATRRAAFLAGLVVPVPAAAQVTLDGSLGPATALSGPAYQIGAELGRQVGGNLFHSFSRFDLRAGDSATFSGPDSVAHIIGRITGGQPSSIDGLIRATIPQADLYLINPAGMVFGPNAALDVPGSFHAATATTVELSDGGRFHARDPAIATLSAAPPAAFGFLDADPSALRVTGSGLAVPDGASLSLLGGELRIDGATLEAVSGRINLAALGGTGRVSLGADDLDQQAPGGDMTLSGALVEANNGGTVLIRGGRLVVENSLILTHNFGAGQGGLIDLRAQHLELLGGALLDATTFGPGQGGDIRARVTGAVLLAGENPELLASTRDDDTGISLFGFSGMRVAAFGGAGGGDAGRLQLSAGNLLIDDGAKLFGQTFGDGAGGDLEIEVADLLELAGENASGAGSLITTSSRGAGRAGSISVRAGHLRVTEGGLISSTAFASGDGNTIDIQVTGEVLVSGESSLGPPKGSSTIAVQTASEEANAGQGGSLFLRAGSFTLADGGIITSDSFGPGQGGDLTLNVLGDLTLSGVDSEGFGSLLSTAAQGKDTNAGNGGQLSIHTRRLLLTDGGTISSSTFGPGGDAGPISLQTTHLSLENGALISAASLGAGQGGNIAISAATVSLVDGSQISSFSDSVGGSGDIRIQTGELRLLDGGALSASSIKGTGRAGAITVESTGNLLLLRNGLIQTTARKADGGNIQISAGGFLALRDSTIATSVQGGAGDGGNITLVPQVLALDNSRVEANAFGGRGGNIDISVIQLITNTNSLIEASSQRSIDGTITIDAPDTDISSSLALLPGAFLDAATVLPDPCTQRLEGHSIRLFSQRYQRLPDSPDALRVTPAVVDPTLNTAPSVGGYPPPDPVSGPGDYLAATGCHNKSSKEIKR